MIVLAVYRLFYNSEKIVHVHVRILVSGSNIYGEKIEDKDLTGQMG